MVGGSTICVVWNLWGRYQCQRGASSPLKQLKRLRLPQELFCPPVVTLSHILLAQDGFITRERFP